MPRSFRRKYLQSGGRRHLGLAEKIIGVIRRIRRKGMVRSVEEASEFIDVTTFRQSSGKSFQAYAKNRSQPHCFSQLSGSRRVTQTCRRPTAAGRMTTCKKKVFDGFGVKATQRDFKRVGHGDFAPHRAQHGAFEIQRRSTEGNRIWISSARLHVMWIENEIPFRTKTVLSQRNGREILDDQPGRARPSGSGF